MNVTPHGHKQHWDLIPSPEDLHASVLQNYG